MQIKGFTELIKHWKLQCGEIEWLDGKNDLDKGYVEKNVILSFHCISILLL